MESLWDASTAKKPKNWKEQREPWRFPTMTAIHKDLLMWVKTPGVRSGEYRSHIPNPERWMKTPRFWYSPAKKPALRLVACPAAPFHFSPVLFNHPVPTYSPTQPERGLPQEPAPATTADWIHPSELVWQGRIDAVTPGMHLARRDGCCGIFLRVQLQASK